MSQTKQDQQDQTTTRLTITYQATLPSPQTTNDKSPPKIKCLLIHETSTYDTFFSYIQQESLKRGIRYPFVQTYKVKNLPLNRHNFMAFMKEVQYHKDCSYLMVREGRSPEEESICEMGSEKSQDDAMEYEMEASPDSKKTTQHEYAVRSCGRWWERAKALLPEIDRSPFQAPEKGSFSYHEKGRRFFIDSSKKELKFMSDRKLMQSKASKDRTDTRPAYFKQPKKTSIK